MSELASRPAGIGELRLFGFLLGFAALFWTLVAHCAESWDTCTDHLRDLTSAPGGDDLLFTVLLVFSGTCFVLAALLPRSLAPLHRLVRLIGEVIHRVISRIALALLFFVAITPMGLGRRALRGDPLRLRWDAAARSYWLDRNDSVPARDRFRDPF